MDINTELNIYQKKDILDLHQGMYSSNIAQVERFSIDDMAELTVNVIM